MRSDTWYKNAIVYCVAVDRFQDSDGDGLGDFPGLTGRLDYLAGLGVTCLWLLPFYPSLHDLRILQISADFSLVLTARIDNLP